LVEVSHIPCSETEYALRLCIKIVVTVFCAISPNTPENERSSVKLASSLLTWNQTAALWRDADAVIGVSGFSRHQFVLEELGGRAIIREHDPDKL
jgi:hypothetical protein